MELFYILTKGKGDWFHSIEIFHAKRNDIRKENKEIVVWIPLEEVSRLANGHKCVMQEEVDRDFCCLDANHKSKRKRVCGKEFHLCDMASGYRKQRDFKQAGRICHSKSMFCERGRYKNMKTKVSSVEMVFSSLSVCMERFGRDSLMEQLQLSSKPVKFGAFAKESVLVVKIELKLSDPEEHRFLEIKEKASYTGMMLSYLRRQDLNLRPPGYEPDELPDCSTPRHSYLKEQYSINKKYCQ